MPSMVSTSTGKQKEKADNDQKEEEELISTILDVDCLTLK
tara:strand:- start:911 stop:1030 length:120 start_codon:yes stop_codon:yes gene_type:complete